MLSDVLQYIRAVCDANLLPDFCRRPHHAYLANLPRHETQDDFGFHDPLRPLDQPSLATEKAPENSFVPRRDHRAHFRVLHGALIRGISRRWASHSPLAILAKLPSAWLLSSTNFAASRQLQHGALLRQSEQFQPKHFLQVARPVQTFHYCPLGGNIRRQTRLNACVHSAYLCVPSLTCQADLTNNRLTRCGSEEGYRKERAIH